MSDQPVFGQRQENYEWIACYRHPREQAISKCKRCQRDTCLSCTIPTEVSTICAECAGEVSKPLKIYSGGKTQAPQPAAAVKTAKNKVFAKLGYSVTNVIIAITVATSLLAMLIPAVGNFLFFNPILGYKEPWRFLTVMLVHGGLIHLALNMYSLYLVGNSLERVLGTYRYLALYVASGLGGSLAVLLWAMVSLDSFYHVTVGASGAIFGLFAAVYVVQRKSGMDARAMGILLAVNLALGFTISNVSWQGHLGGMIVGALMSLALLRFALPRPGWLASEVSRRTHLVVAVTFILLVAAITAVYWLLVAGI
ncbi:peptidase, S54 family [Gleimia coleocanis DSM 15436]|uniref:Peptidase, S54 family n=1 Tax=Gleimia coleocanis DSM 15436 TaxID=525245 RepID=C0VY14_9ACTO|nr:rhomboid family intramembrane serine protease [Gleimia coleocanis]EEH64317.1 peptidase, S54 family [Gleimia coleocanis DSM 15436]